MKNIKFYPLRFLFIGGVLFLSSCQSEDALTESQIDTTPPQLNELDQYIRDTFVTPYNIDIEYKYDINEVDQGRFLYPPRIESVRPMLDVLQKVWIEPHNQVGGPTFVQQIAPRQFTLIGSFNFNQSATITLGLAEAGTKISLFNIDFIDYTNIESIKQPLKTIQHEYGHILNQTEPFEVEYGLINPANYTAQWFNRSDAEARQLGYITAYASSSETEDFVEMVSEILTSSVADFNGRIEGVTDPTAKAALRRKEALVKQYYLEEFQIDLDELQRVSYQALLDVVN